MEDVGVELAPGDLGAVGLRALRPAPREIGEHRPRMDLPVLEVHRHPRRSRLVGPVTVGVVARDGVGEKLVPPRVRRGLACFRQVGVDRLVLGDVHRTPHGGLLPLEGVRVGVGGAAPAVLGPRSAEGREHLERVAVLLAHAAGCHGVRRSGADQLVTVVGQRLADDVVTRRPVRAEVGSDVHRCGPDRGGDPRHLLGGIAPDDEQPPAQRRVERAQRPIEIRAPGIPRRTEQGGVQHEQRVRGGRGIPSGEERRLVAHPQVAAEPDHGRVAHGARR